MKIYPHGHTEFIKQAHSSPTKTAAFVKFLIKICFLPIAFKKDEGKIRFKFMSRKSLVFFIIYFGSFVIMTISLKYIVGDDFFEIIKEKNILETLSVGSNSISGVAIIFPLLLARGLDNMDVGWVSSDLLPFPKHGRKTICSYFGSSFGSNIAMLGYLLQLGQPYEFTLRIVTYSIAVGLFIFIFWTFPALCVESWIEKYNQDLQREESVFESYQRYKQLSRVFSSFLFLFYLVLQLLIIVMVFASIMKFVNQETAVDLPEYLMFGGYMLAIGNSLVIDSSIKYLSSGSHILNLVAVTFTVESAFDSVGKLLERTEERLLRTREKSERQKLKYEMRKLSKLEPMTGGGFFQISKSTLTSMLSVRLTKDNSEVLT